MNGSLPATTAQWTTRKLQARGVDLDALLEGTGLSRGWLENGRAEISVRAYEQLVLNALDATGEPWLGLTLGVDQKLPELGIWGYAVMASETLDDAADVAHRFWAVSGTLAHIELSHEEEIDRWGLSPVFKSLEPRVWRFVTEETLAATMTSGGLLCGRPIPYASVEVSYPRPSYGDRYLEVLGVDVRFDADRDIFTFPRAYGPMRVVSHDAEIADACLRHCEARAQALGQPDLLVHSIQKAIVESSCRLVQLQEVAEHLGLGRRTLQRRLREESGTTFQSVRDELRARLAKSLLRETSLSVEAVAHRLGFSAATNFRVAFKRWTGMTVRQFRLSSE